MSHIWMSHGTHMWHPYVCDKSLDKAARDNLRIPVAVADVEEKSKGESSEGDHAVPQNVDARKTTGKSVVACCGLVWQRAHTVRAQSSC